MRTNDDQPTSLQPSSLLRKLMRRLLRRPAVDPVLLPASLIRRSGEFDFAWYLAQYPDVTALGMDPVVHYLRHGAFEGRQPNAQFDSAFYLDRNPDVAASGINPFQHYLEAGRQEGRKTCTEDGNDPTTVAMTDGSSSMSWDVDVITESGLFDPIYYLDRYPGVASIGTPPLVHYLKHGAKEGKNPCALFDTKYYLTSNPDVLASGMNALVHFCKFGAWELRNPSAAFDSAWYWLSHSARSAPVSNPLQHYLANSVEVAPEIRGVGQVSVEDRRTVREMAALLLEGEDHSARAVTRLGIACGRLALWSEAEAAFRRAAALEWGSPRAHERLATALEQQGKWWQVVESLERATSLDTSRAGWLFRLGEAQEKMNRFSQAAESFQSALRIDGRHADWYYRLGYACERSEEFDRSEQAYTEALARHKRKEVKRFGVGVLHQMRGYWPEAAEAYGRLLSLKPLDAELNYKHGMAHDRCYRWPQAETAYRQAIGLDPTIPYWHYRYGFVLERQQRWLEAAEAYAAAATLAPERNPYWHYRCGYVLDQVGNYEKSCLAYLKTRDHQELASDVCARFEALGEHGRGRSDVPDPSKLREVRQMHANPDHSDRQRSDDGLETEMLIRYLYKFSSEELIYSAIASDATEARRHYLLGEVLERRQDWMGAAYAYSKSLARSNPHRPEWWYRLGYTLFRAEKFQEAAQAFRETRLFRLPHGINTGAYSKNNDVYRDMQYRECLSVLALQPRTILYESTHGASVGGNPYAIFEYLIDHPNYDGWTHVWIIAVGVVIPIHLRGRHNVIFVEYESYLYCRYLATATYLINDSTFPYWFSRRKHQKYLNTWHGTPLKTLGKSIRSPDEFMSHRNIQRNMLHATHLISPNEHTSDVLMNDFDVRGICSAKLAETGYPRIDRTINASPGRIAELRGKLALSDNSPVVLYAPTWRGVFGQTEVDIERLRSDIQMLSTLPCQLVFRGHPFSERLIRDRGLPVLIASPEFDTADVLAVTDILITDYSSIFFDFLPTGRPIFHYCYDLEEYSGSRGLYFSMYDMPGAVCRDMTSLVLGISRQLQNMSENSERYRSALAQFCPHEDGRATQRTVEFFFNDCDINLVTRYQVRQRSLLFFGGHFAPNGINSSFLNLMHALQESGLYSITVAIEPHRVKSDAAWLKQFQRLPAGVRVLGKVGRMVQSPAQAWLATRFRQSRMFASSEGYGMLQTAYRDEYRRCFGDAKVDVVVDFDGYNGYWACLFGMGTQVERSYCWLHNDIAEEFVTRYPNLRTQFAIYDSFVGLVSVSAVMELVNFDKLGSQLRIAREKFTHCRNLIDGLQLEISAKEPLDKDLVRWFKEGRTFLTMGRMSPEKDHAKLIDAFARVHADYPDVRLVIFGDGPLRHSLQQQIDEMGLIESIYLAGQRANPFPALKRCSCFVLSSNHEGQPMVLLEAMALARPIIATDIDGNRGVLGDGYGLLVENSVTGLEGGMRVFVNGSLDVKSFDVDNYCLGALREFDVIAGRS